MHELFSFEHFVQWITGIECGFGFSLTNILFVLVLKISGSEVYLAKEQIEESLSI